ncbi:MAG: YidC/Oxa1 family insertase periplasmic-domain containing protein [Verrucomicrobiota bacterium]
MDRTAWIVVTICVVLLLAWQPLMDRLYPTPEPRPVREEVETKEVSKAESEGVVADDTISEGEVPTLTASSEMLIQGDLSSAREFVLENTQLRVVLTTLGGGIDKIELKEHYVEDEEGDPIILHGINKVPVLNLQGIDWTDGYTVVPYEVIKANSSEVVFKRKLHKGGYIVRTFTLDPENEYLVNVDQKIVNDSGELLVLGPGRMDTGVAEPIYGRADERTHLSVGWKDSSEEFNIDKITAFDGFKPLGITISHGKTVITSPADRPLLWSVTKSQFFSLVVDFSEGGQVTNLRGTQVELPHLRSKNEKIPDGIRATVQFGGLKVKPSESLEQRMVLFAGPTYDEVMTDLNKKEVMEHGYFGFVSRPLLLFMNAIYKVVGNYGWAIVIMTIIIKLVLWYPQTKANLSMKKMQVVAPIMKEMQEKFKDKPDKLQQEMMKLYKDYGVNPVGGCLPILLQMPIFIGFYWMLLRAIELRHEGWIWWVSDLSKPDTIAYLPLPILGDFPINPLPILMAASMFLSFQMTPKPQGVDNPAQHIFKFMPIIFLIFCYNFASALSLYWTVQNLLGIVQMYFNLKIPMPTPEELKAKAEEKKKVREALQAKAGPGMGAPAKKARGPRTQKRKKR